MINRQASIAYSDVAAMLVCVFGGQKQAESISQESSKTFVNNTKN
jgi:hypothetical protein